MCLVQYLRELVDVRAKLGSAQEVAESRAIAAATAESQCASLMKEIESQGEALQGHEARSADLARQMLGLRQELRCKEASEQQLREEMERLGVEMKLAIAAAASQNHGEMSCALEGFLQRSSEHLSKGYVIKDEEISRMRDEIRLLSLQLKAKAQELDAQVFPALSFWLSKEELAQIDLPPYRLNLEFYGHSS
jgi:chromosome segregation ATPase